MPTTLTTIAGGCLLALGLTLAGCGGTEPLPDDSGAGKPAQVKRPVSTDKHPVPVEVMDRLYAEVAELSGRQPGDVELVRAERRRFRDASLDCPQPNMGYAQVIVDGYWVIMRAGGEEFDYRIDNGLRHTRCTGSTKQAPIVMPRED